MRGTEQQHGRPVQGEGDVAHPVEAAADERLQPKIERSAVRPVSRSMPMTPAVMADIAASGPRAELLHGPPEAVRVSAALMDEDERRGASP